MCVATTRLKHNDKGNSASKKLTTEETIQTNRNNRWKNAHENTERYVTENNWWN